MHSGGFCYVVKEQNFQVVTGISSTSCDVIPHIALVCYQKYVQISFRCHVRSDVMAATLSGGGPTYPYSLRLVFAGK